MFLLNVSLCYHPHPSNWTKGIFDRVMPPFKHMKNTTVIPCLECLYHYKNSSTLHSKLYWHVRGSKTDNVIKTLMVVSLFYILWVRCKLKSYYVFGKRVNLQVMGIKWTMHVAQDIPRKGSLLIVENIATLSNKYLAFTPNCNVYVLWLVTAVMSLFKKKWIKCEQLPCHLVNIASIKFHAHLQRFMNICVFNFR